MCRPTSRSAGRNCFDARLVDSARLRAGGTGAGATPPQRPQHRHRGTEQPHRPRHRNRGNIAGAHRPRVVVVALKTLPRKHRPARPSLAPGVRSEQGLPAGAAARMPPLRIPSQGRRVDPDTAIFHKVPGLACLVFFSVSVLSGDKWDVQTGPRSRHSGRALLVWYSRAPCYTSDALVQFHTGLFSTKLSLVY